MNFPILCHTRAGSEVNITGHYLGYDRPWVGFIKVDLEDAIITAPFTWLEGGAFVDTETLRALDLIDLPE